MSKRLIAISIVSGSMALAALVSGVRAQPAFNPSFIISDAELEDYMSMDEEEIRLFLATQGSALATLTAPDASGTTRLISEIIYNASRDYRINPRYTLVTLQKEQSLIEEAAPSQHRLDWAMGYGVCDGCSTSDPALAKYRGIGRQIDYAVGTQRIYLDDSINRPWLFQVGRAYQIDSTTVMMSNRATAAMYNYTPHLHGNQLFWRLWSRYFTRPYPDGTLLKATASPDVWLVDGGLRRRFSSWTSLITRFNPDLIVEVSPATLETFEVGREIRYPQYALLEGATSGKKYLYADDRKRFIDAETFRILGFNPAEIEEVPEGELAAIPSGEDVTLRAAYPLGTLLESRSTRKLYHIQDGISHEVLDRALLAVRFPNVKVRQATSDQIRKYETGEPISIPDGTIAKSTTSPAVYIISHGQRRPVLSGTDFEALGYSWANVRSFSEAVLNLHQIGEPLRKQAPQVPEDVSPSLPTFPLPNLPSLPSYIPPLPTFWP